MREATDERCATCPMPTARMSSLPTICRRRMIIDVGTDPTPQQRWQLAGSAAEVYQEHLVPAIFGPWARIVVDAAGLRVGDRVLDVACGPGTVAREVALRVGPGGSTVGLDNNPSMLAVARVIPPPAGTVIDWREGDATALPFADGTYDVVLCQAGLQFFSDRLSALREMRRVLIPGGRSVVLVWQSIDASPGFGVLADALERHLGPVAATLMRAPFALGDRHQLQALMQNAGFHDVRVREETGTVHFESTEHFVHYQVAGSPLAAPVGDASAVARDRLLQDVRTTLAPYETAEGLVFPVAAHVATASA
jgi:ubiquinone/menaquinone biosynthesis C-methylase UbiE